MALLNPRIAVLLLLVFGIGAGSGAILAPILQKKAGKSAALAPPEPVACPTASEGLKVVVAFGQSNAANYGGAGPTDADWGKDHYRPQKDVRVLDWQTGQCFRANDPLPGADGRAASLWGRFGDAVIARSGAGQVLIVAFGVGATTLADWTEGKTERRTGEILAERLPKVASALGKAGYKADMIAFQQGESDRETSYADYRGRLETLAGRVEQHFGKPLTVAISTLCQGPASPDVTRAIRDVAATHRATRLGPDLDKDVAHALDRMDRCHLSRVGLEKAARLWVDAFDAR